MTIDPSTLTPGTVAERAETDYHGPRVGYILPGGLWSTTLDAEAALKHPKIVRTFSPDPLPSQEVPRDEWANIKPGSRVRIEFTTPGETYTAEVQRASGKGEWIDTGRWVMGYDEVARVFVLGDPADPDADLIERMAEVMWAGVANRGFDTATDETRNTYRNHARAALAVVRESEVGA